MTNYSHRDKTEEWDFAHTERAMTDATALAKLLRDDVRRRIGSMCREGRPPHMRVPATRDDDDLFICDTADQAADLIDSLSQRLAAAERERDEAKAEIDRLVLCYSDLMHSHDHWKSQATEQASSAERRNAELTKHVEDRENCCRQLLDTYAARQHELEQENTELARRVVASLEFTPDEMNCVMMAMDRVAYTSDAYRAAWSKVSNALAPLASHEPPTSWAT